MSDEIRIEVPKGLEDLVPEYLEARRRDAKEAAMLLAGNNFKGLITIAHNMAGSGASYGFDRLSKLGANLELAARAGDAVASEERLDALRDHLDRIRLA
jgi:HPt (histidine-containing phosphotransfer) domain-containing protein